MVSPNRKMVKWGVQEAFYNDTKRALLNVMEDLEATKKEIELEKIKAETILASMGEGLIVVDSHGKIVVVNSAAEKITGQLKKELLGKEIELLIIKDEFGEEIPRKKHPAFKAFSSGKSVTAKYLLVRSDSTKLPISINATPIKHDGKITSVVKIFRDISKESEVDKEKSEFVSLASHQLRTPLGIIKWYLEVIKKQPHLTKGPAKFKKYFEQIYKSNEQVLCLMRELLSVSRIDQGNVKNNPSLTNVTIVIANVVEQMRLLASKKKIKINFLVKNSKNINLYIDELRFREVVQNLIVNAITYSPEKSQINVTLTKRRNLCLLTVEDFGYGILKDEQPKIFTKFFRSQVTAKHYAEGSGLGLYVVKSYVEGWGGKVGFSSIEGEGSKFTITLPMLKKMAE